MPSIEVVLTPALWELQNAENKNIVVIDIFRATSTICAALHFGASAVLPIKEANETLKYKNNGYLTAGERNGQPLPGFDFGNSPVLIQDKKLFGNKLALTTTNGTKCFDLSKKSNAAGIFGGSFMNLSATANYLTNQGKDIVILCAGWKDQFNLEDSLYAGALVSALQYDFDLHCDAALMTMSLYQCSLQVGLVNFLKKSSHYQRLNKYDAKGDMELCLSVDVHHQVVQLVGDELVLI